MKVSRQKIANNLADHTLGSGISKRYAEEVAAYLLSENRVNQLDSILRDIASTWEAAGHLEVMASSAYPLSASVKQDILKQVKSLYPEAKTIKLNEIADPEIIGGVRLSLPDKQLDLSVEAKLDKFKQLTIGKE